MAFRTSKRVEPGKRWWAVALLAAVALLVPSFATAAGAATITNGQSVWVGGTVPGSGGTAFHGVHLQTPADPKNPGTPDFYAYCIEHDIGAVPLQNGIVGAPASYLGSNHYSDPTIQGKVNWVLQHSYPTLSLTELAAAAGLPSISLFDATEATQYAIWRYTDLDFDANWNWNSSDSEATYWYLVNGANASSGSGISGDITVTITPPAPGAFPAGTIAGPFIVHTNQTSAKVASSNSAVPIVDGSGSPVDVNTVVDGQQIYLDLRAATAAGATTITATVAGASGTGHIITSPRTAGGTATAGSHGQTLVLVVPGGATTSATADASWTVPAISTTLLDAADGDHDLVFTGGTVVDTIAYKNLVPGQQYTVSGELMRKSDGSATGITGSKTFTPTTANGSVDVTFTVPSGYAGETLVAFEKLYRGEAASGTSVATHEDIDDAAQTVVVDRKPAATPTTAPGGVLATTGAAEQPVALAGVALLGLIAGATALAVARRRRAASVEAE